MRSFDNPAAFDPQDSVGPRGGWKFARRRDDHLTRWDVCKERRGPTVIEFREHIIEHEYRC